MVSSTPMTQPIQDLVCIDGSLMLAMPPEVARAEVAKRESTKSIQALWDMQET
jgi:hypothetical protein